MNIGTPRILIVNAHSQANAGDCAIVLAQLRLLKKIFPAARLAVTSRTAKLDRPLLAARGAAVIAPIFNAPSGASGKWRSWGKTLLSLIFPLQALAFLRRLGQADLVMACGGGYFYSTRRLPGLTFWQNYLHLRLAVMFGKDVVFFPQSYGPLKNPLSRRLLAGLIASDRVRAVLARERISLSVLEKILPAGAAAGKLQFCPDMALFFAPEPEVNAPSPLFSGLPNPRLALALRDWDFPAEKTSAARKRKRDAYLAGLLSACRVLHGEFNASFLVFSQAQGPSLGEDDRRFARVFHDGLGAIVPASHLRLVETLQPASPAWVIDLLRQADMLVTSRMHAALFAFLAGIPAAVIGYQHKSLGILQALGLDDCALPIEEVRGDALARLCADLLRDREKWRERIAGSVSGVQETIEAKFQAVFAGAGSWAE